jgi:hypothetical protein
VVAATALLVPSLRSLNLETAEPGDDGLGPIDTTIAATPAPPEAPPTSA